MTHYMLDPELGAKEMVTDRPRLLPELTCGLLSAMRPRRGRKGLEVVWTEEMTFEVSLGRRPEICPSDKAGRIFLV